jgi:hypothetical protein
VLGHLADGLVDSRLARLPVLIDGVLRHVIEFSCPKLADVEVVAGV